MPTSRTSPPLRRVSPFCARRLTVATGRTVLSAAALAATALSAALLLVPGAPSFAEVVPEAELDAARSRGLRYALADWRSTRTRLVHRGLHLEATVAPDAVAYKIVTRYLGLRERGATHAGAVEEVAVSLPRWKRYERRALVILQLELEHHELGKLDRRILALDRNLEREGLTLRPAAVEDRLPLEISGKPKGLRLTELRIKKFWRTRDGTTLRRPGNDDDPAGIGRAPLLSEPFPALVLEDDSAEIEILTPRAAVARFADRGFDVGLRGWKLYEGPFIDDVVDLNDRRPFEELEGLFVRVPAPPAAARLNTYVRRLVDEVRRAAEPGETKPDGGA